MAAKKSKTKKKKTADNEMNKRVTELEEEILELKKELEKKTEESEEYLDHLQRLKAEFENYKKRVMKEKLNIANQAKQEFISKFLDIVDNFERAMEHKDNAKDKEEFIKGIEMIENQMINLLTSEGVEPIEAIGSEFDPTKHEAVMCVADENHPDNTVVEEIKKGYMFKDKLIRPSMVKVSKNEC